MCIKYDGKIDWKNPDLSRFELVLADHTQRIYSAVVNCVFLKANIRLAYVQWLDGKGQVRGYRLVSSTDVTLAADRLVGYYQARFQQEYLIRDGKQFLGLSDSQARSINKLESQVNLSLTALNIAKVESGLTADAAKRNAFSMADVKTQYHNQLLINRFMAILPETAKMAKNPLQLRQLYSFGCIAA